MDNQPCDPVALSLIVQRLVFRTRVLTAFCCVLGAALALLVLLGTAGSPPKEIEATRFVLRDASGRMRGELTTDDYGPKLSLYDTSGLKRVQLLGSEQGGSSLIMWSRTAERFGGVQLFADTDSSTLLLNNVKHKVLVAVTADQIGPSMALEDAAGYKTEIGVSKTRVPSTGKSLTSSAASIQMSGVGDKIIWSAP